MEDQTPSYQVHSIVHSPRTRTLRASAPVHYRRTQFVLDTQARLIPGRPVALTHADMVRNLEALKSLEGQGIAEVRTVDGRKVDLSTLMVAPSEPLSPSRIPRDDRVVKDPAPGQHIFTAPGQPGYERHAAKPPETVEVVEAAPPVVEEVAQVAPIPPSHGADVSLEEMAHAFGGPPGPEDAPSADQLSIEDGPEIEHVEASGKSKKKNRR